MCHFVLDELLDVLCIAFMAKQMRVNVIKTKSKKNRNDYVGTQKNRSKIEMNVDVGALQSTDSFKQY